MAAKSTLVVAETTSPASHLPLLSSPALPSKTIPARAGGQTLLMQSHITLHLAESLKLNCPNGGETCEGRGRGGRESGGARERVGRAGVAAHIVRHLKADALR